MKNCQYIQYDYSSKRQAIIDLFPEVKRRSEAPPRAVQHKCDDECTQIVADILQLQHVDRVIFFQMHSDYSSRIHVDGNLKRNLVRTFALNLPLTACNHSWMRWYKQKPDSESKHLTEWLESVIIPLLDRENAEKISEFSCNKPMIVKINDWHDIRNTQCEDEFEYYISIRFDSDITVDDVLKMTGSHVLS